MIRRPPRSTLSSSSAASDVYKRQMMMKMMGGGGMPPGMEGLLGGMGGDMGPPRPGNGGQKGPSHDVEAVTPNETVVENLFKRKDEFGNCSKDDIRQALKESNNNKAGSAATILRRRFA
eukprot:TRINITY_DN6736_c0_g1_i1.p1 TRINITY_DN6736_c0_g1~~TRINITY_DN6736_c0_g1_i1.p1  ORF type:complete len:119 (+),score=25.32 TRINITY_DN6736_c0_g1_i1:112-468(+)